MNFTEHAKIRNEKFGTVIFETLTEKIFITNGPGAKILQLIQEGRDMPSIVGELKQIYTAEAEIEKDTAEFIDCLRENNFITGK